MAARCIYAAARFKIAELVKDRPKSIDELAQESGANSAYLYRVLRALASIGIFEEVEPQQFAQTELSHFLLPAVPGSMYAMALLSGADYQWNSWGAIEHCIRSGKPALDQVYGSDVWTYLTQVSPADGEIFSRAMTAMSEVVNEPIASAYDFSEARMLVDVGGGHGSLLAVILRQNPHLQGVLFDRPHVLEGAGANFTDPHLSSRIHFVAGDFFEDTFPTADTYIMKQIMQDWSDKDCIRILRKCREHLKSDGRVLVTEQVLLPGRETSFAKFLDVQMMMVLAHGQERTEDEYRALFESAGLRLMRVVPTASVYSILEGVVA